LVFAVAAEYDISDNGTLIHSASMRDQTRGNFSLYWSDRDGNEDLLPVPHDNHVYPRESPDGTPVQWSTPRGRRGSLRGDRTILHRSTADFF
jgi:hypothetical protein